MIPRAFRVLTMRVISGQRAHALAGSAMRAPGSSMRMSTLLRSLLHHDLCTQSIVWQGVCSGLSTRRDSHQAVGFCSAQQMGEHQAYLESIGLSVSQVDTMTTKCPRLTAASIDQMAAVRAFLVMELRLPNERLLPAFRRDPHLLLCSVDDDFRPTQKFLREKFGLVHLSPSEVWLLAQRPSDIQDKMDLLHRNGVADPVSVLRRHLPVLRRDIESFQAKIDYLKSINMQELGELLLTTPLLMTYHIDANLEPTVAFIRDELELERGPFQPPPNPAKQTEQQHENCGDILSGWIRKCLAEEASFGTFGIDILVVMTYQSL